jgi:hypothetical protein
MKPDNVDELKNNERVLDIMAEVPIMGEAQLYDFIRKFQHKHLTNRMPPAVLLATDQFRFILKKVQELEELQIIMNGARSYWQEWAALEVRKALRNTDNGPLIDALETIERDFDHEPQTHQHNERYGGECRCCLAKEALSGLLGKNAGKKED